MAQNYPLPPIKVLERLQVTDGLLMNADRWRLAHEYHRQRQNIHFQSLWQPGIVWGLEVLPIPAPAELPANYRDRRWVQVQPGIAIDLNGNPIVVPQPENYRITAQAYKGESPTIYLTISYVDPEKLQRQAANNIIQEAFRIDEKLSPPVETEIELCRIVLQSGSVELEMPRDGFFPQTNQLDWRYRQQARSRPASSVRVAPLIFSTSVYNKSEQLFYLVQSVSGLYPSLRAEQSEIVQLGTPSASLSLSECDLLFLAAPQSFAFNFEELALLKSFLAGGGTLLIEVPARADAAMDSSLALAEQLEITIKNLNYLGRDYPLRSQPFLFSALPTFNQEQIRIECGGGIILVAGELANAWGIDEQFSLPRETIRSAQELGINILHFAQRRRQLSIGVRR